MNQTEPSSPSISARIFEHGYTALKKCRHGYFLFNVNDNCIGRSMDLYGEWAEAEILAMQQFIHPGDVILDVGANMGTHAVFFANAVGPGGQVYAFEPQRFPYQFLCSNIMINGLSNVVTVNMAVGDVRGKICVPVLDPTIQVNFGAARPDENTQGEMVSLVRLDDLLFQKVNLIKIDVEGMEAKVLAGALETINTFRPLIFVENNKSQGSPGTVQLLFDLGYQCWWHIAPSFLPDNYFKNPVNIFEGLPPEGNMVCIPRERNYAIHGLQPVTQPEDNWVAALRRMGYEL